MSEEGFHWKLPDAAGDYSMSFTYDSNGAVTGIQGTGAASEAIGFEYDARGYLTRITDGGAGSFSLQYDDGGNMVAMHYPDDLVMEIERDAYDRATRLQYVKSGELLYRQSQEYDARRNIVSTVETGGQTGNLSKERTFTYSLSDRLTGMTPGPDGSYPPESYTLDPEGNRTASHQGAGWVYDAAHRLLESPQAVYTYDADGSMRVRREKSTGDEINMNTSAEGRIIAASGVSRKSGQAFTLSFSYDAQDRRIAKTINGETIFYAYAGGNLVAEYGSGGVLKTRWVYGPGVDNVLVMLRDVDGDGAMEPYYYIKDHLGTVKGLVDGAGEFVKTYNYDSYGNLLDESGGAEFNQPFTYTGREWDADLGLYYHRARWYDPETGRFVSEDPEWTTNPYPYVGNSPLSATDPSGTRGEAAVNHPVTDFVFTYLLEPIGAAGTGVADIFYLPEKLITGKSSLQLYQQKLGYNPRGQLTYNVYQGSYLGLAGGAGMSAMANLGAGAGAMTAEAITAAAAKEPNQVEKILKAIQDANPGAHFLCRHGAQTTISQHANRLLTRWTPDGVYGRAVFKSSKVLKNSDLLTALLKAADFYAKDPQRNSVVSVPFGRVVGTGVERIGGKIVQYPGNTIEVIFRNDLPYTIRVVR